MVSPFSYLTTDIKIRRILYRTWFLCWAVVCVLWLRVLLETPVYASYRFSEEFVYSPALSLFGTAWEPHDIYFSAVDLEKIDYLLPSRALFKMSEYGTFIVGPAVLFRSVEKCWFCLSNVGFHTSNTFIVVDNIWATKDWCSILVGC